MSADRDDLDAIEELLPWYATGALSANEKGRVEKALAREPRLQASLKAIREDLEETIALNQDLPAPRPAVLDRIMAAVEGEPPRPSVLARLSGLVDQLAGRLGRTAFASPRAFAFGVFVAALVVIGQGAAIVSLLPHAGGAYSTASQESPTEGAFLLVGFAPEATAKQIADLLQQKKAVIVDKTMSKEQRDAALAAWRGETIVKLALPAGER
jgi:anti-sigma-K factor RskA